MLALLAIEGERSGYDLLKLVQQAIAHVWSPARSGLYAVLPRLATKRARLPPHRRAGDPTRQAALLDHAHRPCVARRVARDHRAGCARHLLPEAVRRQADDARGPACARGAVRRRHRRAARGAAGDRADEYESRPRLVPPAHAPVRDRAGRARAPVGGRSRARPEARAAVIRVLASAAALAAALPAGAHASSWTGSFRLPANAEQVALSVELTAGRATVALGPGHMGRTTLTATNRGGRVRFTLPGGVVFDGRRSGRAFAGTVRQGALRGTFRIAPGTSRVLPALGLYRAADGAAVAVVQAIGLPTWLVELPSGDIHGLNAKLTTVGARVGNTSGAGSLAVTPASLTWTHAGGAKRYTRVRLHQREVRVGVDAATLSIPDGPGPFPAVVMTHGSGPQTREEFQVFAAFCELLGIAVIADDKRGIGQSRRDVSRRARRAVDDRRARTGRAGGSAVPRNAPADRPVADRRPRRQSGGLDHRARGCAGAALPLGGRRSPARRPPSTRPTPGASSPARGKARSRGATTRCWRRCAPAGAAASTRCRGCAS